VAEPLQLVLATRNAGKVAELRRILAEAGTGVRLIGLADVVAYAEPAETGSTFAENALLKATACVRATGHPALADDSGLVVDALGGMPGVLSARWSGRHGDDATNVALVLDQLADVPPPRRGAAFVCAAAYVALDGTGQVVEARWEGQLTWEPRGENGFGYDPIFVPVGESKTSAELTAAQKDAVSHRGQAFRGLVRLLAADTG